MMFASICITLGIVHLAGIALLVGMTIVDAVRQGREHV